MLWKYEYTVILQGDIFLLILGLLLLIYPIYFLIVRAWPEHFDKKLEAEEENEQRENNEEDSESQKLWVKEQGFADEEHHTNFFVARVTAIEENIQNTFKQQTIMAGIFGLIVALFVYLVFEEKFTYFYIVSAFLLGLIVCIASHCYTMMVGKYGIGQYLIHARHKSIRSISFGYECGIAMMAFLLGLTLFFFELFQEIFMTIYGDKPENFQKIMIFLCGGYTLGYVTGVFFYRLSATTFSAGANIAACTLQKTENLNDQDFPNNPCIQTKLVADYFSEFIGTFSDFSTLLVFSIFVIQVLITDSQEMLDYDVTLYFALMFLFCCFICSFIGWLIGYFALENNDNKGEEDNEEPKNAANYVRMQILITVFLVIITYVLFTLLLLPSEFTLGFSAKAKKYESDKELPSAKKFFLKSNATSFVELNDTTEAPPKIKNWEATICMVIGTLSFFLIFIVEEYFTSHYYEPVRSLVNLCEDETSLALLYSKFLGTLPQVLIFVVILCGTIPCQFICGYWGLALFTLAYIGMCYTLQGISTLSGLSQICYKVALLSKLYGSEKFRVFNIRFAVVNYQIHIKSCLIVGTMVVGMAAMGAYYHYIDNDEGMKGNIIGLSGVIFGMITIGLMRGIMFSLAQILVVKLLYKLREALGQQFTQQQQEEKQSEIVEDASAFCCFAVILPFIICLLLPLFFGLCFGTNFIFGFILGATIISSYLILESLLSSTALINAKFYLEDRNALIRKDDARYQGLTTGNAYAHSYRDTGGSSLLIFLIFIITICLLSAPIFEQTAWITKALGLDGDKANGGGPYKF